jgi:flagellar biogenesis protein FliO
MQSTYDLNTIIIIIAFLIVLILISFLVNKKKDLLRSKLGSIKTLNIISNSMIGNGSRITVFSIKEDNYLVITNKSSISNIISLPKEITNDELTSGIKND